ARLGGAPPRAHPPRSGPRRRHRRGHRTRGAHPLLGLPRGARAAPDRGVMTQNRARGGAIVGSMTDRDRDVLFAVGGALQREIAIDELLERMVDHVRASMEADRGTIYLLDRGKGELFSRAAHLP